MPERYSKLVEWIDVPWWAYDALIFAGLVGSAAFGLFVHWIGFVALLVLAYGSFVEPRILTVKRFEVGKGDRAVTIAFLSDLHAGQYKGERWFRRLAARTNALGADLILLGGDYVLNAGEQATLLAPLANLKARLGVFGMLGNHDDYYGLGAIKKEFELLRIPLLANASVRIPGHDLSIVAVDDDWYGDTNYRQAFAGIPADDAVIALVHNPEVAMKGLRDMPHKPALMLSGHDHGGQIRLPLLGSVPNMPHNMGRRYDRGRFDTEGTPLIIGQGVGESGPRARLFCPPQIVYVTLKY